jgi:hypothetical protein
VNPSGLRSQPAATRKSASSKRLRMARVGLKRDYLPV